MSIYNKTSLTLNSREHGNDLNYQEFQVKWLNYIEKYSDLKLVRVMW